jgi:hypothetical protein
MPRCDTQAMTAHLAEISAAVEPGAHAVLILDQAGWHMSKALVIPDNITLLPLPPRSPELKPRRERLAVHPREVALEPHLHELRRHRCPQLRGMEPARRTPLEDHEHRSPRLGPRVLITASWDNCVLAQEALA